MLIIDTQNLYIYADNLKHNFIHCLRTKDSVFRCVSIECKCPRQQFVKHKLNIISDQLCKEVQYVNINSFDSLICYTSLLWTIQCKHSNRQSQHNMASKIVQQPPLAVWSLVPEVLFFYLEFQFKTNLYCSEHLQ